MGLCTQRYRDKEFGIVHLAVRANARSIIARWKGGEVHITVPPGVSAEKYNEVFESFREKLRAQKPQARYNDRQRFDFEGFSIVIEASLNRPNQLSCDAKSTPCVVRLSKDIDFTLPAVEKAISKAICYISQAFAADLVLKIAFDQSKKLGIFPAEYTISNGARTLGRCSSKKVISLSSRLSFLPEELRRFVICHELAHLKEMNHSERFHALVNEYTNGREAELNEKLNKFKWPIIR